MMCLYASYKKKIWNFFCILKINAERRRVRTKMSLVLLEVKFLILLMYVKVFQK